MTLQHAPDTMPATPHLLDEMSEVEKHAFEDHFFDCGDCAEEVRRGDLVRQEVRRAARGSAHAAQSTKFVAFPKRPAWQRPSVILPWAAAATLAIAVGY